MIRVFVADSSAVVRSVLKEIIFKTKKLEWIGEAASFSELKDSMEKISPDFIIAGNQLFENEKANILGDFYISANIPSIFFYDKNEKNLPVIRIAKRAYCVNKDKGIENILDAGPAEFISLISGASFVLTNSFHGTAFSINMQVTFCAVISSRKNNNSRIENLLIQLGLEDRLVREEQNFKDLKIFDSINYNRIEEKLSSLKNLSESFIRQALYS